MVAEPSNGRLNWFRGECTECGNITGGSIRRPADDAAWLRCLCGHINYVGKAASHPAYDSTKIDQ